MTDADRSDLIGALNELLEAERAGARVALASRNPVVDAEYQALIRAVHADESRWCAMLSRQIERLGGKRSPRCGAFYEKAMQIGDVSERLAFLNRGQAWVVRKIEALLPRVAHDSALHADLGAMLESHRANIGLTEVYLDNAG